MVRTLLKNSKTGKLKDAEGNGSASLTMNAEPQRSFTSATSSQLLRKHPDLAVLTALLLVQVACFLPLCFKVGFYLDDWLTFWNLHFAPHNPLDLIKSSLSDPRMVTRPIQCIYYGLTYFFFGDRPLPYHILRWALEFLGVVCLYLGLLKLSGKRIFATLAALFFILYPNHDATHYWVGAGLGPGFGLTLYLGSFALLVEAVFEQAQKKRIFLYAASLFTFALCAFCYESFLPMLSMSFCTLMLSGFAAKSNFVKRAYKSLLYLLPFVGVALAEPFYQRVLLPRISKTFLSPSTFDLNYFLSVFPAAADVSFGPEFFSFCFARAHEALISFSMMSGVQVIGGILAAACALAIAAILSDGRSRRDNSIGEFDSASDSNASGSNGSRSVENQSASLPEASETQGTIDFQSSHQSLARQGETAGDLLESPGDISCASDALPEKAPSLTGNFAPLSFIISGIVIFLCSYLTFAVAQGYTPVLETMLNRVNIGGSVAMSIIFAALLSMLSNDRATGWAAHWRAASVALPLLVLFILANLGLSAFWICSWEVQKNTRFLIQKQAAKIKAGDCIILAHTHRYLMWAPVFDGTWDFQSMIRMTLNRNDIQGGVISDRLSIQGDNVVDNSLGYVCASYPADKITLLIPSGEIWIPTRSASGFVEAIENNKSNVFIDQSTLDRWRAALSNSSK